MFNVISSRRYRKRTRMVTDVLCNTKFKGLCLRRLPKGNYAGDPWSSQTRGSRSMIWLGFSQIIDLLGALGWNETQPNSPWWRIWWSSRTSRAGCDRPRLHQGAPSVIRPGNQAMDPRSSELPRGRFAVARNLRSGSLGRDGTWPGGT